MSVQASTVVNTVRDLIPDPVYDASGVPHPEWDGGLFRAQTLYRWINDAVKSLAEQMGWTLTDWTALAVTANQPWYSLNPMWHDLESGYQNAFQLSLAPESFTVWPSPVTGTQSSNYSVHRQTDHLEVGLFPIVNTSDPTTTLNMGGGLSASATSATVVSTAGFLTFGYVQIDSEIIAYRQMTGTTLTVLTRGQCGTSAATHANGATVSHLSAWFTGVRMPMEVATATDLIELPSGFIYAVQEYVMAKASIAQSDQQGGKLHMDSFRHEAARIKADPNWRSDAQGVQTLAYGYPLNGRLVWGNVIVK